jgi:HlyD family secretion protein
MRLDDTLLKANLEIYRNRLAEATSRRDRLIAERNGDQAPRFQSDHPLLQGRDLSEAQEGETAVFMAQAEIQAGRKAQLEERIRQFGNQIDGVEALITSKRDQVRSLELELERLRRLLEKKLVREPQVLEMERSRVDLVGQIAEHVAETARIRNSIQDTRLEILQTDRQFREDAVKELRSVTAEIEELTQQILTTRKQLDRVVIVAPVTGYVHEMQIVTIGGVVPPGAVIAQIIASDQANSFELHVSPVSVDQIWVGQPVRLRFSAFNQRTTPELTGSVVQISPTTVKDQATGATYYRIIAATSPEERAKLGTLALVPGMPVEGFIGTNERSVLAWLIKPVADQFSRAFHED